MQKREHDFEPSESCHLRNVQNDTRMTTARCMLIEPRTRAEIDNELVDISTDSIAPLFNHSSFKLLTFCDLAGDHSPGQFRNRSFKINRPESRAVLKPQFGEFKSLYSTWLSRFEASAHRDS